MSERISKASENYERVVSEEGLRGVENDGPPDELWGSGFERGSGVHKRIEEELPPEKLANLPSVAEQFAIETGLLDEETGRFDEEKVLDTIKKLPTDRQKDAREALFSLLKEYSNEDKGKTDTRNKKIEKKGNKIIRTIADGITVEDQRPVYNRRPKEKRVETRIDSPEDIDIWIKLNQIGDRSKNYLFMDLKSWDDVDKVQQSIKEQRDKLSKIEDSSQRSILSKAIEDISEKLHLNKMSLERKGIKRPFIFRKDKKGRDILFNEESLYAWVDAQDKSLKKSETAAEAVFSIKSQYDLNGVREIIADISKQLDSSPNTEKKERQIVILNKLQDAYKRADNFLKVKTGQKSLPAKPTPDRTKPRQEKREKQPYQFQKDNQNRAIIDNERALFTWVEQQNKIAAQGAVPGRLVFRINSPEGLREVESLVTSLSDKIDKITDKRRQEKERVVYNRVAKAYRSARAYLDRISRGQPDRIKREYKGSQPPEIKIKKTSKITENK
jgi:hypothetical protein